MDAKSLEGLLFGIGIFFLILFAILSTVSKKKNIAIFMGIGDLILLVIALVSFAALMVMISDGFQIFLFLLFLIPFLISIFLTLRKPYSTEAKVFSICAKCAFVLMGISAILMILGYPIIKTIREHRGKGSLWDELKDMSKNHQYIQEE